MASGGIETKNRVWILFCLLLTLSGFAQGQTISSVKFESTAHPGEGTCFGGDAPLLQWKDYRVEVVFGSAGTTMTNIELLCNNGATVGLLGYCSDCSAGGCTCNAQLDELFDALAYHSVILEGMCDGSPCSVEQSFNVIDFCNEISVATSPYTIHAGETTTLTVTNSHTCFSGKDVGVLAIRGGIGFSTTDDMTLGMGSQTVVYPADFAMGASDPYYTPPGSCSSYHVAVEYYYSICDPESWFEVCEATPTGTPPTVAFTSVTPGPPHDVGVPISLTATANDVDGDLVYLRISCPGVTDTWSTAPFPGPLIGSVSFTPSTPGTYDCEAVAIDDEGNEARTYYTIVVGGCEISLDVRPAPPAAATDPLTVYNDFEIQGSLVGCADAASKNIEFTIVDPLNGVHKVTALTDGGGSTEWISYLHQFDNSPSTESCGYYTIQASGLGRSITRGNLIKVEPPASACDEGIDPPGLEYMVRKIINCGGYGLDKKDVVACCDLPCCLAVGFDKDCTPSAIPPKAMPLITTRSNVKVEEIAAEGLIPLCAKSNPANPMEYDVWDTDSTKYRVIGAYEDKLTGDLAYDIVDLEDCIVADVDKCEERTETIVIDRDAYMDYIRTVVVPNSPDPDMILCRGFYATWMPPYDYALSGTRYIYVYDQGFVDYFYCYHELVPEIIRKSNWCHNMNLAWYSVFGEEMGRGLSVNKEQMSYVRRWNDLSGYVVLGHVCPWCMNRVTVEITEGIPTEETRWICTNFNTCTEVSGPGANTCSANGDCTEGYNICDPIDKICLIEEMVCQDPGSCPSNECTSDDDCAEVTASSFDFLHIEMVALTEVVGGDAKLVNFHGVDSGSLPAGFEVTASEYDSQYVCGILLDVTYSGKERAVMWVKDHQIIDGSGGSLGADAGSYVLCQQDECDDPRCKVTMAAAIPTQRCCPLRDTSLTLMCLHGAESIINRGYNTLEDDSCSNCEYSLVGNNYKPTASLLCGNDGKWHVCDAASEGATEYGFTCTGGKWL